MSNCFEKKNTIFFFCFRTYENQMDGTFTFYKYIDPDGNTNEVRQFFV